MNGIFAELKRRNVFRVGIAYVVSAWVVAQVAELVLSSFEAPSWVMRAVLLSLAVGLPLALFLAWAFELTPEGIKKESEVDRSQSITAQTGRKLDFAIIGLLVLALGYFAYDKFVLSDAREAALIEAAAQSEASEATESNAKSLPTDNSIAVLPFVNMSADEEQEYFSDGLTEELLNLLARIPELRVIARTSSFYYKDKEALISDIARELNVAYVLEGSVRSGGKAVRITAQLISAEDSSHLWSKTYDRTLDDIFGVQDEIAAAVVEELKMSLLDDVPTAKEMDPEVYPLYLQARELSRRSTQEGHQQSIELYRQVLAAAPDLPAAWAGLAENYLVMANKVLTPIAEGYDQAKRFAGKALALDPEYAPAHAILGWVAMVHDHDLQGAARHLERALQLDPTNTQIVRPAAILLFNLTRFGEAIELLEYGVARDPVSSALYSNLALNYFAAGRAKEAVAAYRSALRLSPEAVGVQSFIGQALLADNKPAEALAAMQQEPSEPWRLVGLAMAHHALGEKAQSDQALSEMIEKYGDEWRYNIAYAVAFRGEVDRTFEWLEKAREINDAGLSEVVAAPEFANVRSDPRWLKFLESIDKAPQQLAAIDFTVTRSD